MKETYLDDSGLYEECFQYKTDRSNERFFAILAVIVLAFGILRYSFSFFFSGIYVDGTSMCNTLQNGDFLYINKRESPSRGDIIVIDVSPYREKDHFSGDYIIKRLIATEGDSLYCTEGQIYIKYSGENDFVALEEDYTYYENEVNRRRFNFSLTTVGDGEIFFLGDNRTYSKDSSEVGCYNLSDVCGVVTDWSMQYKNILTFIFGKKF